MASEVKNYFLAPSWDYVTAAKPGVTIALWNLVKSPTEMVPPLLAAKSQPKEDEMLKSPKGKFEWLRERGGEKKYGVWTTFLQAIGLELKLGHHRKKSVRLLYKFDTIETREAYPTPEYVQNMVKDASVVRYLKKNGFDRPLYVVVGTKAVTGAMVRQVEKKKTELDAKVAVDVMPFKVSMSLGPELSVSSDEGEIVTFKESTEFIFAFRLRRIRVNEQLEVEDDGDEREGTALGNYGDSARGGFEVIGMEDIDSTASALGSSVSGVETEVEDDDETLHVVAPSLSM